MRRCLKIFFVLIALFLMTNVYAKCGYNEKAKLMTEASNIKVAYEAKKRDADKSEFMCEDGSEECGSLKINYLVINILNLSNKFYIIAENDVTNEEQVFYSTDVDKDGIINFKWEDVSQVAHFTFYIYSSDQTSCVNEKLRTLYLTLPRENFYNDHDLCTGKEELDVCKEFVTVNDISYEQFQNAIDNYEKKQKEENKNITSGVLDYIKNHKLIIAVGIVTLVVGIVIGGTILRKRKEYEKFK